MMLISKTLFGIPKVWFFSKKSKKFRIGLLGSSFWGLGRAAVCDCGTPWTFLLLFFVTSNYCFETGNMTGILENLKWESLKKRRRQ